MPRLTLAHKQLLPSSDASDIDSDAGDINSDCPQASDISSEIAAA